MDPVPRRHLKAVPEELDPLEALRRALGDAAAAPDLGGAFGAIAAWLAPAVGARTALVIAAGPEGHDAEASAGPLDPVAALRHAVESDETPGEDVVIRYVAGLSEARAPAPGPPRGAVVVVVPSAGANDEAQVTGVVHAFAELAELCLVQALRLHHAESSVDSDVLTGCLTRRALERVIAAELLRSQRTGEPFSVAFFDIDGFKRINDELGHVRGDAVLGAVGGALATGARATDFVGRYGGDEFIVVMPGTDAEPAAAACARLVTGVAAASREAGFQEMGLSFGAATWAAGKQATALIEEADRAMFASKPASGTATSTGEA